MFGLLGILANGDWGIWNNILLGESLVHLARWVPYLILIRPEQIIPVDWRAGIKLPHGFGIRREYQEKRFSGKEA